MTIPKRPIRKKITGLPAFTTIRGGAYFFLPGHQGLALPRRGASARDPTSEEPHHDLRRSRPRPYNQVHVPRKYTPGKRRVSVYVTLELSRGGEPRRRRARQPLLDDDRGAPRRLAGATRARSTSDPDRFQQGIAGTLELFFCAWVLFQDVVGEVTGHPSRCSSASTRRATCCRSTSACSTTPTRCMVFGLDHMVTEQEAAPGGDRGAARVPRARGDLPRARAAPRRRRHGRSRRSATWSTRTTATRSCRASSASAATRARS